MFVYQLIERLEELDPNLKILVSSDEECNNLFKHFEIEMYDEKHAVLFGLSGSEFEEYEDDEEIEEED